MTLSALLIAICLYDFTDSPDEAEPEVFEPGESSTPKKSKRHLGTIAHSPGKVVSRVDVMNTLKTENKDLTTGAVNETFKSVKVEKHKDQHKNIRHS